MEQEEANRSRFPAAVPSPLLVQDMVGKTSSYRKGLRKRAQGSQRRIWGGLAQGLCSSNEDPSF